MAALTVPDDVAPLRIESISDVGLRFFFSDGLISAAFFRGLIRTGPLSARINGLTMAAADVQWQPQLALKALKYHLSEIIV